jgi:hypothetical protein
MAEIASGVLNKQGLSEKIPDPESMRREAENQVNHRNNEKGPIDWKSIAKNARGKLERLYPK